MVTLKDPRTMAQKEKARGRKERLKIVDYGVPVTSCEAPQSISFVGAH